ncbi:MAG TPA: AmmeMemoRadiSam system protein B [Syntrophobacteraceae bacterium]|nr:AmmeMemoRadiSam system protein B [Syntrophobacteraceae bacterium]
MRQQKIRESVIAGSWYPGNPETLRQEITRYVNEVPDPRVEGTLLGLICPHAGYMYSGGVAAHAYKLLTGHPFDRVLIVAPSHRAHFPGASLSRVGGYRTPLGVVPLDDELTELLGAHSSLVGYFPNADSQEHSLEIQLPFLQVMLKDFRLTPVLMGEQSPDFCRKLADVLADACRDKNVLLVASTDLSHYHSQGTARRLDQVVLDRVGALDPEGLSEDLEQGRCEACGGGPMVTVMLAAKKLGAVNARVLQYATSGDVSGDTRQVVGYLSAAIFGPPPRAAETSREGRGRVGVDLGLSPEEKDALRRIAYEAIRSRCLGTQMPEIPVDLPKLEEKRGAFVCLHKDGSLRGCIGMIEGKEPLHRTVQNMAVQAAFADPRFCALAPEELEKIDLEISVLTPLERIQDPSEVKIGKHGLFIRKGYHSGLLLPQVATEHGWGAVEFLEWTCRKAGLPPHAWKAEDAEIYVFSADIF